MTWNHALQFILLYFVDKYIVCAAEQSSHQIIYIAERNWSLTYNPPQKTNKKQTSQNTSITYKYQRKMIACIRCKMVRWKNNNLMSIFFSCVAHYRYCYMCIYVCIKVFSFCYSTELENIKNRQSILNTRVSLYLIFLGMQAVISLHFWYSVKWRNTDVVGRKSHRKTKYSSQALFPQNTSKSKYIMDYTTQKAFLYEQFMHF